MSSNTIMKLRTKATLPVIIGVGTAPRSDPSGRGYHKIIVQVWRGKRSLYHVRLATLFRNFDKANPWCVLKQVTVSDRDLARAVSEAHNLARQYDMNRKLLSEAMLDIVEESRTCEPGALQNQSF